MKSLQESINESVTIDSEIVKINDKLTHCNNKDEIYQSVIDLLNGISDNGNDPYIVKAIFDWTKYTD